MPDKIALYPIYALAQQMDDEPFDLSALPFEVVNGVAVEGVAPLLGEEALAWVHEALGRYGREDVQRVRYALVHRYSTPDPTNGSDADQAAEKLLHNLAACLRLVRPMRQRSLLMRGELGENRTINLQFIENPIEHEVPEVQKLFHVRNRDLEIMRSVAGEFLRGMEGDFWKFRMAVQFHEIGHFRPEYWKTRYLL